MEIVRLINVHARIFDLEEARQRLGLEPRSNGNLKGGRDDRGDLIVATTNFQTNLPAHVLLSGTVQLGISRQMLMILVTEAAEKKAPVVVSGAFFVNEAPCTGTIIVDFAKKEAEIIYFEQRGHK